MAYVLSFCGDWMQHQNLFQHCTLWVGADTICYCWYVMERAWTDLSLNSVSILTCVILDKTVNFSEAQVSFSVKVEIILYTCWQGLEIMHTSHLTQHLTFSRDSITGSSYPSALPYSYTHISFLILATTL